jgi:hypothetical protein
MISDNILKLLDDAIKRLEIEQKKAKREFCVACIIAIIAIALSYILLGRIL